jgi:hypothetical protein
MSGETILTVGYGQSENTKSPLFEYGIVFYILSLFYSSGTRIQVFISLLSLMFFSFKAVLFGGRIEAIQCIIAFMYFRTDFFRTWSLKKLYLLIFSAFIVMIVIGRIRANPMLILDIMNDPLVIFNFSPVSTSGIVSSNYGDVQHASARMVGLVDIGVWDLEFRIKSFLSYLFNLFLFGTELKNNANLAAMDQSVYGAGGGGLISAQFYVWLGWLGPIVAGSFLGVMIKKGLRAGCNIKFTIYGFCLLITFPRWYAYGPLFLVKFCLIALLFYMFFQLIASFLTSKKVSFNLTDR